MRAYFFGNFYLSSIQQGIQAAHVVGDLSVKYGQQNSGGFQYRKWAANHKTMILLNGGMAADLRNIVELFNHAHNHYCWTYFCEEEAALEGSITSVGIVLPEKIYEGASMARGGFIVPEDMIELREDNDGHMTTGNVFSKFECELMELMNSCRLAS